MTPTTAPRARPPLPPLVRFWPPEWQEEYQERVAILMDSHMTEERAERAAEHIVRDRYDRGLDLVRPGGR